ncbi:hypothetical protein HG66A1_32180 [Gimesia chilikensis]|uniref:Uncharacterized protein n=2 Tax=Gimesia chilikensis TaxID=2605989 RepID=A0A517PPX2_9PLAN|nr:hypothetical protein HG66A1_32180 [Gimesia chilikensis]
MDFLMNDLSIHGQFNSKSEFFNSIETVMKIRNSIRKYGRELFCNKSMSFAQVTRDCVMQQSIQSMHIDKRRALMQWLTHIGPFWIDERLHKEDEWLEAREDRDVANSAVGEAAYRRIHGSDCELVSMNPSEWVEEYVRVKWLKNYEETHDIEIPNHTSIDTVSKTLEELPATFYDWDSLEQYAKIRCDKLHFAKEAFTPFRGHPYAQGVAEQIMIRLQVLNRMCECFDKNGNRTKEGDFLYEQHFTGEKAWFSDSGRDEKIDFKNDLTFPHPEKAGEVLFCTWHGKVKTPQIRIHFSWPIAYKTTLYVVYVGPKITKR